MFIPGVFVMFSHQVENERLHFLPAGVKNTPVVVLLEGHLSVTRAEDLLTNHSTLFLRPCHPVRVDLQMKVISRSLKKLQFLKVTFFLQRLHHENMADSRAG